MSRARNVLIALDQLANALANGAPDETLSSRAHRARMAGKPGWRRVADFIDRLFFWDADHCLESWKSELQRRHLPREMWLGENHQMPQKPAPRLKSSRKSNNRPYKGR